MEIARNILAFIGTFLVISTTTMLLLQIIACAYTGKWSLNEKTDYRIVITGILVALILIPYYYLPA